MLFVSPMSWTSWNCPAMHPRHKKAASPLVDPPPASAEWGESVSNCAGAQTFLFPAAAFPSLIGKFRKWRLAARQGAVKSYQ